MRNGGLIITLPKDNKKNLRWSKSFGDCLYDAIPTRAENSQQRIQRVIGEKNGNVDGKTEQSETSRQGKSALHHATGVGERGIQLAQRLAKIRFLINEDGVPRRFCNSIWMGTKEYPSIMSMWRKFQSSAPIALSQKRIHS